MKDYGNNPDWYTDAGGSRYHRKPTARRMPTQQEADRHPLYGPGIGHKRIDRLFDGIITAIILTVGTAVAFAMVGMLRTPEPAIEQERDTIECQR
jgi:hypothetical protein